MENEIMRFEEVMEFLSIGKNTLYTLLNNREINAFKSCIRDIILPLFPQDVQ